MMTMMMMNVTPHRHAHTGGVIAGEVIVTAPCHHESVGTLLCAGIVVHSPLLGA